MHYCLCLHMSPHSSPITLPFPRLKKQTNAPHPLPCSHAGSVPYLIPLFDGLRYSKFFFMQFPAAQAVLAPLEPLIRLYFSVPFAGCVCARQGGSAPRPATAFRTFSAYAHDGTGVPSVPDTHQHSSREGALLLSPSCRVAVFFAVYLGIINNFNFSRYVRFNAMQAILLDIILM
jgi:hypothetical protein